MDWQALQDLWGATGRLRRCEGWRLQIGITVTVSSSNYRPFGCIGSWLNFVTAFPYIHGCLLRSATVSPSNCRPVTVLGPGLFFYLLPAILCLMKLTYLLVVISMPVKEKDISSCFSHHYIPEKNV